MYRVRYYNTAQMEQYKTFDGTLPEFNALIDKMAQNPFDIIVAKVCEEFGVNSSVIFNKTRLITIKEPRQVVQWFLYYFTTYSLKEIANLTGLTEHSTVINSYKKIDNIIDTETSFAIRLLNLENDLASYGIMRIVLRNNRRSSAK